MACGYGGVACEVTRHKKCRMMFHSHDFSLIQGWGCHCLASIWRRHWTYFEWKRYDLRGFRGLVTSTPYLMGGVTSLTLLFMEGCYFSKAAGEVTVCFAPAPAGHQHCCGLEQP